MTDALYIIDGHAQIYRAYYALPGLSSRTGEPTNATYGFVVALLKLLAGRRPKYLALAMDAGSSQRDELDKQYKAHRKPMPEDMPPQIERICQIAETLAIPILRVEGFEADDVIATLVAQLRRQPDHDNLDIFICSRDKDLDQLIDPRVRLYDIQTAEVLDAAALRERKGYQPQQAADVLALTGDAADNIPGVPGVGPKTAAKWIQTYGTLDGLLAHAADIQGKAGETLRHSFAFIEQARQLVRLRLDVPLRVDLPAMAFAAPNLDRLAGIFQDLDFQKLTPMLRQVRESLEHVDAKIRSPEDVKPGGDGETGTGERRDAATRGHGERETRPGYPDDLGLRREESSRRRPTSQPRSRDGRHGDTAIQIDDGAGTLFAAPLEKLTAPATHQAADAMTALGPADTAAALAPSVSVPHVQGDYRLVNTPALLQQMLADLVCILEQGKNRFLAVDTETDALGAMRSNLCGISLCVQPGLAWYVAIRGVGDCLPLETVQIQLGPLLRDATVKKIGQNLKYDINVLRNHGLPLDGVFLDTMVASYVLDASRRSHALDALSEAYLHLRMTDLTELIGTGRQQISFAQVALDRACLYSAADADVTFQLAELLHGRLQQESLAPLFFDLEMPIVSILADMEYAGVKVDTARLAQLREDIGKKLVNLKAQILAAAGTDFNPDSPKQVAHVLFERLGLPVIRKNKSGPSTDVDVLESLADRHPVPALLLEYRQLAKLKNTYLEALAEQVLQRTGRVHASFNQTIAETGRLSSSDPNLQNIPIRTEWGREIRRAFIAQNAEFCLLAADYSQVELRLLAHFCREPALLEAFSQNQDIHQFVAAQINHIAPDQVTPEMRRVAKTVNFGIIYGQSAFGLAQVLKIPRSEAEAFISAYKARFAQIDQFTEQCVQQAKDHGYVTTILGRRRKIPEIQSPNPALRNFGRRAAVNTVIQGSAADLIKKAMVNIQRQIGAASENIRLILQVHDELVFECRLAQVETYAALVRREMETALPLTVPLKVDLGWSDNWLTAK